MKKKIFFLTAAKPEGVAEPKKKEVIKKKSKSVSTRNGRLRSVLSDLLSVIAKKQDGQVSTKFRHGNETKRAGDY